MVVARRKLLDALYDVETTEALALENGIILASELMLPQVIIESNSLAVVQAMNSRSFHGTMGLIIQGGHSLLSQFWKLESSPSEKGLQQSGARASSVCQKFYDDSDLDRG